MRTKIYYILLILSLGMMVFSPAVPNQTAGILTAFFGFFTFLASLLVSPY